LRLILRFGEARVTMTNAKQGEDNNTF